MSVFESGLYSLTASVSCTLLPTFGFQSCLTYVHRSFDLKRAQSDVQHLHRHPSCSVCRGRLSLSGSYKEATFGGDFLTWRCVQLSCRRGVNCQLYYVFIAKLRVYQIEMVCQLNMLPCVDSSTRVPQASSVLLCFNG